MQRLTILLLLVFLLAGCGSAEKSIKKIIKPKAAELGQINFQIISSTPVYSQSANSNEVNSRFEKDSKEVLKSLEGFYLNNFLNPTKLYGEVKTEERMEYISPGLFQQLSKQEKQNLFLNFKEVKIVKTNIEEANIEDLSIYYDEATKPRFCALKFTITAKYELVDGNRASFHGQGDLLLEPDGNNWQLTNYQMMNEVKDY